MCGLQPGILVPEALGLGNWVKAQEWAAVPGGQATYLGNPVPWGTLPTILVIEFVAIAFAEHQRTMEKDPEKKKYPGGAFDPLGFSKDPVKFEEYKLKEIKNGEPVDDLLVFCTDSLWASSKWYVHDDEQAGLRCWRSWGSACSSQRTPAPGRWRTWPPTSPTRGTTTSATSSSPERSTLELADKVAREEDMTRVERMVLW
jgi:hypothetical protein